MLRFSQITNPQRRKHFSNWQGVTVKRITAAYWFCETAEVGFELDGFTPKVSLNRVKFPVIYFRAPNIGILGQLVFSIQSKTTKSRMPFHDIPNSLHWSTEIWLVPYRIPLFANSAYLPAKNCASPLPRLQSSISVHTQLIIRLAKSNPSTSIKFFISVTCKMIMFWNLMLLTC